MSKKFFWVRIFFTIRSGGKKLIIIFDLNTAEGYFIVSLNLFSPFSVSKPTDSYSVALLAAALDKRLIFFSKFFNSYSTAVCPRLNLKMSANRDLEGRKMGIAQIYACFLWYFLLKAAVFDVPS